MIRLDKGTEAHSSIQERTERIQSGRFARLFKKDTRSYQDRKAYQREYQRKWRASKKGKEINHKIYQKRRAWKSEQRANRNDRQRITDDVLLELLEYNFHIAPSIYISDPTFLVIHGDGRREWEFLGASLPTWEIDGVCYGGLRWNGRIFA